MAALVRNIAQRTRRTGLHLGNDLFRRRAVHIYPWLFERVKHTVQAFPANGGMLAQMGLPYYGNTVFCIMLDRISHGHCLYK
jgi:hypothetical protein